MDINQKPLALDDFYRMVWITEPRLSPDGTRVAYIQKTVVKEQNTYTENVWISDVKKGSSPYPLSRLISRDRELQWSPDGKYLAMLSQRPSEWECHPEKQLLAMGNIPAQIWIYDMRGGEPRQITTRAEGIESYSWAPDSCRLVFSSREPSPEDVDYLKKVRDSESPGPLVITRTQHKTDEQGYLDTVPSHLFTIDIATRALTQLTTGPCSEVLPQWSPTGEWILFSSNRTGDPDNNQRHDLWLINPESLQVRRLTSGDVAARHASFSPDGRRVAFISPRQPEDVYLLPRLWVAETAPSPVVTGEFSQYVGQGWSEIGGVVSDGCPADPVGHAHVYPKALEPTPMRLVSANYDGTVEDHVLWAGPHTIQVLGAHRAQSKLLEFDLSGRWQALYPLSREGTVMDFDSRSGTVALAVSTPQTPSGIIIQAGDEPGYLLTNPARSWLRERTTGRFQWMEYANHDGGLIEALVLLPPSHQADRTAPLLVAIHGGPMSYEAPEFEFENQYWASQGYVVLLANYRGSTSYGEEFCQAIQGHWGPMEHDDIMSGIDALITRNWVDPTRLYCTGFSMGGIMTNWAIGHTDRFRAAISEHGLWDYASVFGEDDCHLWWQDDMGVPWQNPEAYRASSPSSGLANIHTPLLIMAGEHDWRCPLSQSEQLYVALKKRGVPTELVIYPQEHHEPDSRPMRAVDRLQRIDRWLARYGGLITDSIAKESLGETK